LGGQTHPYSNAWAYYTTGITASLQFTATTIAGTGGTDTHTMSQIAIYTESPTGRSASAYDYPSGTTGQATAYLSLCGPTCEDGNFWATTVNTSETCGQTSQTLYPPVQQGNTPVAAWITWISATANPSGIAKQNGSSVATGNLRKSANCTTVGVVSMGLTNNPSGQNGIVSSFMPNSTQEPNFGSGSTAAVTFTISTAANNPVGGTITASFGLEQTLCTVSPGGPVKTVDISVAN
jgi:hypothetical protein